MASPRPELRIPPLNQGDQLSHSEFERRRGLHPEIKKAELINGLVFLEMTVGPAHADVHKMVMTLLGVYEARHPETQALDNATVVLGDDEVQPDALLSRREGGRAVLGDQNIQGPPELVIEVAASSSAYEANLKRLLYEGAGVEEYAVLQIFEQQVDWWVARGDRFQRVLPDSAGVFSSTLFDGLRLNATAIWAGDMAAVLAALD